MMQQNNNIARIIRYLASLCICLTGCQLVTNDAAPAITAANTATQLQLTSTQDEIKTQKTEVSPYPYPASLPPIERPPATIETSESIVLGRFNTPVPSTTTKGEPTSPPFYFISENTIFLWDGHNKRKITPIPLDQGNILSASSIGNDLMILRERGLLHVDLSEGTLTLVDSFHPQARYGRCNLATSGELVICNYVSDWTESFGFESTIIAYQHETGTVLAKWSYPGSITVIGQTASSDGLYLLPRGQDPGYGEVFIVDLFDAEERAKFSIDGYGNPSLSPNQRYIVAATLDSTLNFYDLADQNLESGTISLPQTPSHPEEWVWSNDGNFFYFSLHKDADLGDLTSTSLGLWRLDVRTGTLVELVPGIPERGLLAITSQNGEWLLVRHSDEARAIRVHIPTESIDEFTLPDIAILTLEEAVFRFPSRLSNDGQWLYFLGSSAENMYLLNIPSGEVDSFVLPTDVVIFDWQ